MCLLFQIKNKKENSFVVSGSRQKGGAHVPAVAWGGLCHMGTLALCRELLTAKRWRAHVAAGVVGGRCHVGPLAVPSLGPTC